MTEVLTKPIKEALQDVEQAFFAGREQWPRPGWVEEYVGAFMRMRELDEFIGLEIARQDLTFQMERDLRLQREHLLWLVRRIGREVFFRIELAMERALRSESSEGAYNAYLRLVEIQDREQDFQRLTDAELLERLAEGDLEQYGDLATPPVPE